MKSLRTLQLKQHPGGKEVTAAMVAEHARLPVSDRTVRREFAKMNVKFYKLKERPTLAADDVKTRKAWAGRRKGRSSKAWLSKPHAIIDNKTCQMYRNAAGRNHAARRSVRGAYQPRGQAPEPHMVKPKGGNIKFPADGVMVTAAVIKGKIRMWEYVEGRWNGAAAAEMYKGPLEKAMARAYPAHAAKPRAKWVVLEDNDPTGYKSGKVPSRTQQHGMCLPCQTKDAAWPAPASGSGRCAWSVPVGLLSDEPGWLNSRCRPRGAWGGSAWASVGRTGPGRPDIRFRPRGV